MLIYYVKDRLGSVVGLQDESGNTLIEYDYDAFGKTYVKAGTGSFIALDIYTGNDYNNDRLFTSRSYDRESGLYFYRARYYDAELGRFISQDSIGIADDINLYNYVGGNPVNWADPLGLEKSLLNKITDNLGDLILDGVENVGEGMEKWGNEYGIERGAKLGCAGGVAIVVVGTDGLGVVAAGGGCAMGAGIGVTAGKGVGVIGGTIAAMAKGVKNSGKSNGGKNTNQYKTLNKGEIEMMKKKGIDIHEIKKSYGSNFDLVKNNEGDIFIQRKQKYGRIDPEPLDYNINNFYK